MEYVNGALAATVLALAGVLLPTRAPAQAQGPDQAAATSPPAAQSAANTPVLQEIVVTGSLISRPALETAEPITILKSDVLREQGIQNLEQALATITTSNPSINVATAVGTFSGGGTYADLRGLGRGRTLVLLDGERIAPNAFDGYGIDLSGVPFSAIENIQVLREGASSLYGTDAVAGVINFITKKNFQGLQLQGNFDRPQKSGGSSYQADFTFGHGDLDRDGYNVLVTGSYTRQQELQALRRDFAAQGFDPSRGVYNTNYYGSWPGVVIDQNNNYWQSGYPACAGNDFLTTYFGDCSYRYSAATDLLPDSHVISGMAALTRRLPANNQVQLQYFWSQSGLESWSGPMFYQFAMDPASPYFPTAGQLTCQRGPGNCSTASADLTGPIYVAWTDPRNARYSGNLNVAQRVLLSFSGTNAGWDYAASANYSKNTNDDRNTGGYPNEDVLAPGGVLSKLINPFGPQSAAGQALIDSAYVNGVYQLGSYTRWSVDGHARHELGDAFNAGTPASFAFGVTVAGERYANTTTPYNDLVKAATGLTDSAVKGTRRLQAAYVELDVPVFKSLDIDISDRQDRYSDFGTTNNAKVNVRYQPLEALTFRGTASTGFRAPTLYNLYSPPYLAAASSGTMGQGNPFCAPGQYTAEWTPATCSSQGIGLFGGNPKLTPETSQNFDFGVILSPLDDLGITLDYFRVLLKNTINAIPPNAIYGNPTAFASQIVTATSGPYAGSLTPTLAEATFCNPYTAATCGYIIQNSQNTGRITTSGIDLSIQYQQQTPFGTFHEDLEGTAVTQFLRQQYQGGPLLNLVGNLQVQSLNPAFRWQHNLRVDWTSPAKVWGAGLSNRFYSSYIDQFPDGNNKQRIVGSYSLVDGYVSVAPIQKLTVLFGIRNILDRNPPYTNASQNNFGAGYNALIADPLLRNFYLNVKYTVF